MFHPQSGNPMREPARRHVWAAIQRCKPPSKDTATASAAAAATTATHKRRHKQAEQRQGMNKSESQSMDQDLSDEEQGFADDLDARQLARASHVRKRARRSFKVGKDQDEGAVHVLDSHFQCFSISKSILFK